MNLATAMRITRSPQSLPQPAIAIVGAGGKTSVLFALAKDLAPSLVTTTTHLGDWQISSVDRHVILNGSTRAPDIEAPDGVTLVTGDPEEDRFTGLDEASLLWVRANSRLVHLSLLIEADGSRGRPLKAPAMYEPVIPAFADTVVVVAGLSGLGKPLTEEFVHHPDIFDRLSGPEPDHKVTSDVLCRVLVHRLGGLKNIPAGARRVVVLNQADTPGVQAQAGRMAEGLLTAYDAVVVTDLRQTVVHAVHEPVAGIILAAGESKRFGSPKPLLDYHGQPFVRHLAQTALSAGLSPVVVVTGSHAPQVAAALEGLRVTVVNNPDYASGQSSSIRAGLECVSSPDCAHPSHGSPGAAIFLLADQPQVTIPVLRALVETHSRGLAPIVAPEVLGQRANPVLFDRVTFPDLLALSGDVGGRAIFSKHPVTHLPWHEESLLVDIDTPEDLGKLE